MSVKPQLLADCLKARKHEDVFDRQILKGILQSDCKKKNKEVADYIGYIIKSVGVSMRHFTKRRPALLKVMIQEIRLQFEFSSCGTPKTKFTALAEASPKQAM